MVALVEAAVIHGPDLAPSRFGSANGELAVGGGATVTVRHQASRIPLRLVETPPHGSSKGSVPAAGIAVAVAVVFGMLLAVRLIQGEPPATSWAELTADSRVSAQALAGPGDHIRIAKPGDTFWALARQLAPDRDPRPVVDLLVTANGGTSIQVGQLLIIPAELVD